jgi:predicted DsbA family dithiol-disulfide isomerase
VGLDRSRFLQDLGVTVVTLPLEIHPEIPVGGLSLADRWGSHYREALAMYERIERECEAAGLPFNRPARVPNTRRALATAEWARLHAPDAARRVERAVFEAHFVDNRPLDDPEVIDELVEEAGADASEARRAVDAGELQEPLAAAHTAAARLGIRSTPTWLLDGQVLIPGAVPRDVFRSVVSRLQSSGAAAG